MPAPLDHRQGQRLFFGLPLPDTARAALQEVAEQRPLPPPTRCSLPQNYHLTLVFLGQVDAQRIPCVRAAADRIQIPGFELQLDRLGHWPRPQALWAAPSAAPDGLRQLLRELQKQLQHCGFEPESREYSPHVTLARRLPHFDGPTEMAAIHWHVREFHLYHSQHSANGIHYSPVGTWHLC